MIRYVLHTLGALVACVGFPFLIAASAYAQAPAPAGEATTERVIVTGSNIPTAEEVGPNPVFSLDRDLISKSGQGTTVEQLLKSQPVMGASSVPVQNNGTGQSGPTGTASIALRGFDPGASLTLVDGRRVAPFPGAANSGAGFVDLLSIPVTAVQTIDILKDGASATYGADAVAGVVNLKLWKDYRGVQVTTQYGNALDSDVGESSGDILFGIGDDKTSITGDVFFYHHNSLFNRDRENSANPPFLSSNATPFNLQVSTAVALAAGAVLGTPATPPLTPGVIPFNAGARVFAAAPNGANGFVPASGYLYARGRLRGPGAPLPGFNFNTFSSSFPSQERWGGYTAFSHKVCGDQLQIYGDVYYVDAKTHDELAPLATGSFQTPGSPSIYIPPNHPLAGGVAPPNTPTLAEVGANPNAFNPFNPFQQIISGGSRARLLDFGNRLIDNENEAFLTTLGFKGDKLFDGTWGYDGAFRYSQELQIAKFQGINAPRLQRILNGADSLFNPASGDFIGQTTPYNPFPDERSVSIPSNAPLINFATLHARDLFTSKLATLDLKMYTTELFKLPAGGVGFAFGGVFSREEYTIDPDDQNRHGESAGVGTIDPVQAGRKEYAFFAEASIPITSPEMGVPGFHSLELTMAGRYEVFLNNDTNAAVPKVGIRWQPLDDQLTLRGTVGQGFLEPSLVELYGPRRFLLGPVHFIGFAPPQFGVPGSADNPLQDVVDPETTIEQLPNKNLGPEHDRNWSAGIVYTPKLPPQWGSLTLSVDLWDVERTGVVTFLSPSFIVSQYNAGLVNGVVSPSAPTGTSVLFDPSGGYSGVSSPYVSGGRENARGVDFGLEYKLETSIGTFSSLTRVAYLDQFVYQFPGDRGRQVAGRANNGPNEGSFFGDVTSGDAWVKWKGITQLDWTWHNFDLNATMHYLGGFKETILSQAFDGASDEHFVKATYFTDAQLSYSFIFTPPVSQPVAGYSKGGKDGKAVETGQTANYPMSCWKNLVNNTTITVGVNNIFDQAPPPMVGFESGNSIGYPGSTYDNIGRFCYVRLVKKF